MYDYVESPSSESFFRKCILLDGPLRKRYQELLDGWASTFEDLDHEGCLHTLDATSTFVQVGP